MRIGLTLIVTLLCAGCSQDWPQCHLTPKQWSPPSVSVDDLNNGKVQVIGRLGKPLGTIVTIRGRAVQPGEPGYDRAVANLFRIESVDGHAINPVVMEIDLPPSEKFPANGTAGWNGYEDGRFKGLPMNEPANETPGPAASTYRRSFTTTFNALTPAPTEQTPSSPHVPAGQFG